MAKISQLFGERFYRWAMSRIYVLKQVQPFVILLEWIGIVPLGTRRKSKYIFLKLNYVIVQLYFHLKCFNVELINIDYCLLVLEC